MIGMMRAMSIMLFFRKRSAYDGIMPGFDSWVNVLTNTVLFQKGIIDNNNLKRRKQVQ